ncbi:MAG: glycosyl transferase [Thermoprotei archaeon]|nr:MAG: glycosyl transferase [Thermoprotei archaeon]
MSDLFSEVTIVIPTLNEAEAIGKVLNEIINVGIPKDNILVVDGGSTDGTVDIVNSMGVKVILQEGKGKADAIRTAVRYIKTPFTLLMDGDYTYPARYIPELYNKIKQGYDLVIGARLLDRSSQGILFKFGNKVLTKFFNVLFGTGLRDVLSGMYIIRTSILKELFFETRSFGIETEIVAHVVNTTNRIAEVPIEYRRRLGKKKLKVRHGFLILREMIRLAWRYNPTFFIFAMGSLPLILGLILGTYVAYYYLFVGVVYYMKGLIAIILTLVGFQSLLLAILSLYLKRMEYRLMRILKRD